MFVRKPATYSPAERARLAARHTLEATRHEAEDWFDSTPDSVDRRIASIEHEEGRHRAALADNPVDPERLAALAYLGTTKEALASLREDLLTASAYRHEPRIQPRQASIKLADADRRWVELEAAKFARDNEGADAEELRIRAANYAEVATSTLEGRRAGAITAAFADRVVELSPEPRLRRTAATNTYQDFPAELIFV
jgi:hypothetical protein